MPTPSRQDIKDLISRVDLVPGEDTTGQILAICTALHQLIQALEDELQQHKSKRGKKKPAPAPDGTGITEGNGNGKCPTSPQSKRVADIFHRRHTTPWSEKEIAAYKKLRTIPEGDLSAVEQYYKSGAMYLRRDLLTFLNNFSGELDRARAWQKEEKRTVMPTTEQRHRRPGMQL